jgi:alkylation response protein AidB-like acyl-CoA dehydrogenase
MKSFDWWSNTQKEISEEAKAFADVHSHEGEEVSWTKKFPYEMLKTVARNGWFGALIPKEYGGKDVGVTSVCIVAEELSRICAALSNAYVVSMIGGVEQLLNFGSEKQKKKWLSKIARGEVIGAVCITEPLVGSDAAGIETTARCEGEYYVLTGKKRFITNAGLADFYVVYARTSEKPDDRAKYQHLTAFIVEKGMPGFSVEKINELSGWVGHLNGVLDFNQVRVPAENRIGQEGAGWKVMMAGLNFERIIFSAGMLGPMREAIRYAVASTRRRIQFNKPTIEMPTNQFKIAEMISGLYTSRLLIYHAAHLLDEHKDAMVESSIAKMSTSDMYENILSNAIQVMGGDAWTRFYPLETYLKDAKVYQIGAGTNQVMRLVIFRGALKVMSKELEMPDRQMDKKLGVPMSTNKPLPKVEVSESGIMRVLAEDYRVNPGLYMTREDLKKRLTKISDEELTQFMERLESAGSVKLYRDKNRVVTLAKATYKGLSENGSLETYKWFPDWLDKGFIF